MKAIIIYYEGTEDLSISDLMRIQTALPQFEVKKISCLDSEETKNLQSNPVDASTQSAIEHAVVYIGEYFSDVLSGTNRSESAFKYKLIIAATSAKIRGNNDNLLKAMSILSTYNGTIPYKLAKRYGFNNHIVSIIKDVTRSMRDVSW